MCLGCMMLIKQIRDTRQTIQIGQEQPASQVASSESISSETISSESTTTEVESTPASAETVVISSETPSEPSSEVPSETTSESTAEIPEPYISPYNDYFTQYPDIAAWFQIPDTIIDYPVMWTPEDETYYLYKHYDGSENINGSLLLDTDSSLYPLTTNLIIHGHNMKSGVMFGYLPKYESYSYYEQHKEMLLYTPDGERTYEVIAVFRSQVFKKKDTCFKYYKFFQANTEEEFNDFYDNIKALSIYDTGVTAEFGDHFITLSTCVSHVENGRFVVVAKEISSTISSDN